MTMLRVLTEILLDTTGYKQSTNRVITGGVQSTYSTYGVTSTILGIYESTYRVLIRCLQGNKVITSYLLGKLWVYLQLIT